MYQVRQRCYLLLGLSKPSWASFWPRACSWFFFSAASSAAAASRSRANCSRSPALLHLGSSRATRVRRSFSRAASRASAAAYSRSSLALNISAAATSWAGPSSCAGLGSPSVGLCFWALYFSPRVSFACMDWSMEGLCRALTPTVSFSCNIRPVPNSGTRMGFTELYVGIVIPSGRCDTGNTYSAIFLPFLRVAIASLCVVDHVVKNLSSRRLCEGRMESQRDEAR